MHSTCVEKVFVGSEFWILGNSISLFIEIWDVTDAIEDDDVPRREDKQALAALLGSTPKEMHLMLIGKGSARAAWDAIRVRHQGTDRVRDTRVRRLRTEFETIWFKDGERIDEFGMRISNLASSLRSLGDACDDEKVVRKFLYVVPRKFVQIIFSMETMMDPSTMTFEEVVGHLRTVEERLEGDLDGSGSGGQLLLTKQQWEAKKRQSHGGAPTGKGKGKVGLLQQGGASAPAAGGDVPKYRCRYCGKKGHWARECRKKERAEAAAGVHPAAVNLAQAEEDESLAMMMACIEEVLEHAPPSAPSVIDNTLACTGGHVFLNEQRAIVTPSHAGEHGSQVWFLDTGATKHMTGMVDVFAGLDRSVTGKVRFADESVVDIRGRGTIVFAIVGGDHRAFTEVFYIPALKSSVVSLGQLDES
jgi:hypothetical protein